jgi:hypothetical protein
MRLRWVPVLLGLLAAGLVLVAGPGTRFELWMGWELVAADSTAGRIEATATTPWFGVKDDVVVRVRPDRAGSRNAQRIRRYLADVAGRNS